MKTCNPEACNLIEHKNVKNAYGRTSLKNFNKHYYWNSEPKLPNF